MELGGKTIPLASLNPRLYDSHWATTTSFEHALGVQFDCPGCKLAGGKNHRIAMNIKGRGDDARLWWNPGNSTGLADLTFVDDGPHTRSLRVMGHPCHSHFNITMGVIDFYGDATSP